MKRLFSFITLLSIAAGSAFAQGNLVQNGSFESVSKKIKEQGSIVYAYPWNSGTEAKADLFNPKSKGEDWGVPMNLYGDGAPKDGEGYAGIVMYSYKDAEPKTYLQI